MKSYADHCLERAEKAMDAPWSIRKDEVTGQYSAVIYKDGSAIAIDLMDADAQFIAHARQDVPEICRRLNRACEFLRYVDGTTKAIKLADELEAIPEGK